VAGSGTGADLRERKGCTPGGLGPAYGGTAAEMVEMRRITKRFGSFTANDAIDLAVRRGEVHALLGENGAGKTTLVNQLYGLYQPTSGEIRIRGELVRMTDPNVAISRGIGMVHQHFMLVNPFSVAENIVLGREPAKGCLGILDMRRAREEVRRLSEQYGLEVDPEAKISDISVGMQQRVEILKALYRGAELLILDEPTAVLTPQEVLFLGEILRNLTAEGRSVLLITHKLREIKAMADRCTIIRRGRWIDTVEVAAVSEGDLAEKMVGRPVSFSVAKGPFRPGEVVLAVKDLRVRCNRGLLRLKGLSLEVRAGEILGLAGVDGNGQSELVEALTGLRRVESGGVFFRGEEITNCSPREVLDRGIATIPEDRQRRGLVADFSVAENLVLERVRREPFSRWGILDRRAVRVFAEELIRRFDVRPPAAEHPAKALSGGNQQKVIIAREVSFDPELLIAAQPTRGLDVGAIEYVHRVLAAQRDRGKAVLLVSLELEEILALADRIAVICGGRITGVLDRNEAEESTLGLLMAGGRNADVRTS